MLYPSDSPKRLISYANYSANQLPAEEISLAEILRAAGYRTLMVGKWHPGDRAPSLPNDFGFDSFRGSLYSNDMAPFAIWRRRRVAVKAPADQPQFDALYTGEGVRLIGEAKASLHRFDRETTGIAVIVRDHEGGLCRI